MGKIPENGIADHALAQRLVAMRVEAGLTLEEVADMSGVSRSTLSRIERGDNSPTANALGRLCAVYNVTMSRLLVEVEDDAPRLIRRSEAATWRDPKTGFVRAAVSPPANGYDIELVWGEMPAGGAIAYDAPPSHGLEQHVVLLDGRLTITINDTRYHLQRGDCLRMKLFGATSFDNPGRGHARYLIAVRRPN